MRIIKGCGFMAALLVTQSAWAQDGEKVTQLVPDAPKEKAKFEGWDGALGLTANLSLAHNDSVVGQVDGFSLLFGAGLLAGLDYVTGPHEWRNTLTLNESFARTPVVDAFIKTNDLAALESLYAYYFLDWIGLFGRLNFETPILPTTDVRADPVDFSVTRLDGTVDTINDDRLRLADPFQPFTMNQSVGAIARPFSSKAAALTVKLGGGGRETFSKGVLVNSDDGGTAAVEITEVDNVFQFGLEGAVGIRGKIPEARLTYSVDFGVLFPFLNNDAQDRGVGELTRIVFAAGAAFSMFEWLALTYQLRILRDPQLIDATQIHNNLLLSFSYDFIERGKPEEEEKKPVVDPELEKAMTEAKAAVERANAAEERAKLAEERAKLAEEKARLAEEKAKSAAEEPEKAPEVTPPDTTDPQPEKKPEEATPPPPPPTE